MNYDKILQNICFGKNRINIWKINKILHNCTNIKKYLLNRFEYVESIQESLYRIKNNIEIRPVCPVCGKYVKFLGLKKKGFTYHCSQYCSNNDLNTINKSKQSSLRKYGVDNYSKTKEFKDRVKETNLNKFGVSTPLLLEKSRNKRFSKEIIDNAIDTKRKNHTFNTSKLEEELYLYIKEKFPSVIRQYKDKERYPFCCDFYIPELDLFLELNGTWTHGKHPFNINSKEDISILNTWKEKSKEHPFYLSAIETWTIRDVKKRNKAKEENLNFHEFWNIEETKQFIYEL